MVLVGGFYTPSATADIADNSSVIEIVSGKESHFFTIETPKTPEEQALGLMYRTSLAEDRGMLFMFKNQPIAMMWMKNTYISLDMLFLDKSGKILYIAHSTTPESTDIITAGKPTAAVLELAGGICKKLGISEGDIAKHPHFTD
ncbi:MAG: DUF192 domain-containing protein [Alphaproteobacteria bacterium]